MIERVSEREPDETKRHVVEQTTRSTTHNVPAPSCRLEDTQPVEARCGRGELSTWIEKLENSNRIGRPSI